MNDYLQQGIICIIVLASLISVVRRLMPKWSRRQQLALAQWLDKPQRSRMAKATGSFLMPKTESGGGCGSGCNTCSTCETPSESSDASSANEKPLQFHRNP